MSDNQSEKIQCPYCGTDMEKGYICGGRNYYFMPKLGKPPFFYSEKKIKEEGGIPMPPKMGLFSSKKEYPKAWHCPECGFITISAKI